MKVLIKLTEPICRKVGQRQITLDIDGDQTTLAEVFRLLAEQQPELCDEFSKSHDLLDASYSVMLNSRLVSFGKSPQLIVKDGDQIAVMLPLAGG